MLEESKGGTEVLVNILGCLTCREKVGGSQRTPLLTLNKGESMPILKKDYEACFKEGFKLGNRLARAKINLMRASDAKMLGDEPMAEHYKSYSETWTKLAKNTGRKFCPNVAHEPKQPLIDLGDCELLDHKYEEKPEEENEYKEIQVGGSGN